MKYLYWLVVVLIVCLAAPLGLIVSIILFCAQGIPIVFRQQRIGLGGKPFVMYKFRTMKAGADKLQQQLASRNEAHGPVFKIHDDPRFTPVGKFLAHTGLDELPQLWNILRGEMAIIGPRPLPTREAKRLTKTQQRRHRIKPGIISPWVLEGYHAQSFDAWMQSDLHYIQQKSPAYDFRLTVRTFRLLASLFIRELIRP